MASTKTSRRGHAGIKAILNDMVAVLPPENVANPAYMGIHTTFGLMQRIIKNAESTTDYDPAKQYREIRELEIVLRKRLLSLKAKKGIPEKMQNCLDELRDAVKEALDHGVDADWMIRGFEEMVLLEEPSLEGKMKRRPEKMIKESRFKKIWEELKEEKEKNRALNQENNELILRIKKTEGDLSGLRKRSGMR